MRLFYALLFSLLFLINNVSSQPVNPWTPPEYFPSKAVLIEWDFNNNIWSLYSELIYQSQRATSVILVVNNLYEENIMTNRLINDNVPMENISFVHVPCERMWIRDHGPLSVMTDTGVAFIDLDDLADSGLDEDLPTNLANIWGYDSYQLPYIFCGGNFMINSDNTLFTTDRIYSNNPSYTQEEIDQDFETYMGITEIITVSAQHDDYWGHIDMQIKLLDDTTFVIASVDPGSGPNYDTLENNFQILSSLTTPYGTPYRIERLPMADNWKTYANSVILNDFLLLPVYNHPRDTIAINTYQQLLPNHEIVGINCNSIIGWGGALHCITMQLFDDAIITSIKDLSVRDTPLRIFPNPVIQGQSLNIICSTDIGKPQNIEVYNIKGSKVKEIDIANQNQPYNFKIPNKGVYIISVIYDNNKVISSQVIVK